LQDKEPLTQLLQTLQNKNLAKPKQKPILLKIAPDLTDEQLLDIIDSGNKIAGVSARIPRLSREVYNQIINRNGWVIRKTIKKRSTEVIRFYLKKQQSPIIG
jgi:dihydroorotate dehydrogenase